MTDNDQGLQLEPVIDELPQGFEILQVEALAKGHRFVERLAADWGSGMMRCDRAGEALLAAYLNGELAGITIDPIVPGAMRMRRFYIRPSYRRGGIGRKLATELLNKARHTGKPVIVTGAPASFAFWHSLGFVAERHDGHTHRLAPLRAREGHLRARASATARTTPARPACSPA
jgi:GNAT superfamily N-acetyltransferase